MSDLRDIQSVAVGDSRSWFGEDYNRFDLSYFLIAMGGEAGEALNKLKKLIRDGYTEQLIEEIKFEIVDTFIYAMLAADHLNMNLEEWYQRKRDSNKIRFGATKETGDTSKVQNPGLGMADPMRDTGLDRSLPPAQ